MGIHQLDRIAFLLAWIGIVSLIWTVVHGYRLWTRWHEAHVRPGTIGGGLWVMFASVTLVAMLAATSRLIPAWHLIATVSEFGLIALAIAVTWLVVQLLRMDR